MTKSDVHKVVSDICNDITDRDLDMETFANYLTIPEVMELFQVENREALITKGGIGDRHNLERVKFASKLNLYRRRDIIGAVEDKSALETILAQVQTERGELVVGDWLPINEVVKVLGISSQRFHKIKDRENVRTTDIDNTTLYNRNDITRLTTAGR